jgi:hypothetical protein
MEISNTPKAVLVGVDRLQSYLDKQAGAFDTIKIANTHNDKTNWRKEFTNAKSALTIPALIEYLTEWSPENAPYVWYICLFKSKVQVERFPFSVLPIQQQAIAGINTGGVDPAFVNQLVEAERKAAIAEFQMNQMAIEQLEDDEDEQDDEPDYVGAIMPMVMPHIPTLIEGLMGLLAAKKPLQVSGVDDAPTEAVECLKILMAHGVTLSHLQKLVAKAKDGSLKPLLMML